MKPVNITLKQFLLSVENICLDTTDGSFPDEYRYVDIDSCKLFTKLVRDEKEEVLDSLIDTVKFKFVTSGLPGDGIFVGEVSLIQRY